MFSKDRERERVQNVKINMPIDDQNNPLKVLQCCPNQISPNKKVKDGQRNSQTSLLKIDQR